MGKCLVMQGKFSSAVEEAFGAITLEQLLSMVQTSTRRMQSAPREAGDFLEAQEMAKAEARGAKGRGNDESTVTDNATAFLDLYFGIQGCFAYGIALDAVGRVKDALAPFSVVMEYVRRSLSTNIISSRTLNYFCTMSMFRYGLLCANLAYQPTVLTPSRSDRPSLASIHHEVESKNRDIQMIRASLLNDWAISLRMFIAFQPSMVNKSKLLLAADLYVTALEVQFRRGNYRATFDPESAPRGLFCPESVAEDISLMIQLMQHLQPTIASNRDDAQGGASSPLVLNNIARLVRLHDDEGLISFCHSLFMRFAAEASTYGRLVLALAAARRFEEAVRIGEMYVELGGKEPAVLLIYAKMALLYDCKVDSTISLLRHLEVDQEMMVTRSFILAFALVRSALISRTFSPAPLHEAISILKSISEESNYPHIHTLLALAYAELRDLEAAEEEAKAALAIDIDLTLPWILLALLKTASHDYEGALAVCNAYLEDSSSKDLQ